MIAALLATLFAAAPAENVELLQFTSAYCPACRTLEPVVDRLAADGLKVRHLDFEANEELARKYNVTRLPTLVLVRQGEEINRVVGAASYDKLTQWLQQSGVSTPTPLAAPQSNPSGPSQLQMPALASPGSASKNLFANIKRMSPANTNASPQAQTQPPPSHHLTTFTTTQKSNLSPDQLALAATVRLKVDEGQGFGYGTGTVVDCHGDEALILTCGHLFRESQGKGKIIVDMFAPGQPQGVEGHLVDHDLHRDVALVSFRPGVQITAAPVAGPNFKPQIGQPVFSIGCDKGNVPSVIGSQLASVDKFNGRPNVTVKGQPVIGRSGGGLFNAEGHLIGVCNAADAQDNEGLYASAPAVHWQLDRIGQQRIYQGTQSNSQSLAVANPAGPTHLNAVAPVPSFPGEMPNTNAAGTSSPAMPPTATLSASDLVMVCVVRSKSQPNLPPQVFELQQLPAEVQQQMQAAHQGGANIPQMANNPDGMIFRGQR